MHENRKGAQPTEELKSNEDGREPENSEETDRRGGRQDQMRQSLVAHCTDLSGF